MKIGVVTTTINIPTVLKLYSAFQRGTGSYTRYFVAGDTKTPSKCEAFCRQRDFLYLAPEDQINWRSSEIIGWNTDSRRNIAILEALNWGADIIVTIDDDMIPLGDSIAAWHNLFTFFWSGLQFNALGDWFDHGQFTVPPTPARGLPQTYRFIRPYAGLITDITIGAAQGIILGVPDTDAVTTISSKPQITGASDILRHGFVVSPETKAVFNSQFTAFRRELAPAAAQFYGEQGRNTDIFASLLMRYECQLRDWMTYYGPPFGYHARADRPPIKDLKAELWGVENIDAFAHELKLAAADRLTLPQVIKESLVLSAKTIEFYDLWFADCREAIQ